MGLSEELLAAAAAHVRELAPELTCTSTSELPQQARSSWVSMTRRSARMRFVTVGSSLDDADRPVAIVDLPGVPDSRRARRVRHGVGGRVDPISAGVGPAGLEPTTPAV